jgi:hypothetical protein
MQVLGVRHCALGNRRPSSISLGQPASGRRGARADVLRDQTIRSRQGNDGQEARSWGWREMGAALGSPATAADSVATAVAVLFTREQLKLSRDQATSSFEDQLEREYRQIIAQLPIGALLGEQLFAGSAATASRGFCDVSTPG